MGLHQKTTSSDDDSAKLKDPASTLAQVKDIVNAKASNRGVETEGDVIEEEPKSEATDEVVAEEETEETSEEVIEEEETMMSKQTFRHFLKVKNFLKSFKKKATTIFETAIKSKVATIKEELQEAYATALVEELDEIKKELNRES